MTWLQAMFIFIGIFFGVAMVSCAAWCILYKFFNQE
jgi:hypothetical protein